MKTATIFVLVLVAMQMASTLAGRKRGGRHRNREEYMMMLNMLQVQADVQATTTPVPKPKCPVYLSFDTNTDGVDATGGVITTTTSGVVSINKIATNSAFGGGALFVNPPGWVRVPSSAFTLGSEASFCVFVRTLSGMIVTNDVGTVMVNVTTSILPGLAPNSFIQVCIVYNGQTMTMYVNKGMMVTLPSTSGFPVSTYIAFGSQTTSGFMDEALICDRALTADEIKAHFGGPTAMRTANLIK